MVRQTLPEADEGDQDREAPSQWLNFLAIVTLFSETYCYRSQNHLGLIVVVAGLIGLIVLANYGMHCPKSKVLLDTCQ